MAGIGFELKRVIAKDSLSGFFKASFSGVFIVAGPWLLSIISLALMTIIVKSSSIDLIDQFFSILVYIFVFSLIVSGGFQYLSIRIFSDYIYKNKIHESLYILLFYMILSGVISFVIGGCVAYILIDMNHSTITLILACAFQSSVINMLWIILIFVSFLKWYKKILLYFILGIVLMVLILLFLGVHGLDQLLFSYTIGNFLTLILLLGLSIKNYPPKKIMNSEILAIFISYWKKYKFLFFTGLLYYFSLWIDKVLFWIFYGEVIDPFNIKLLYSYDMSMYIANLSVIPGMVYFIINSETSFFIKLKKFIISLTTGDYKTIHKKQIMLGLIANRDMKYQSINQLLLTLSLTFVSYKIFPEFFYTLIITLWAAYFQLLLFSYLNYLFYMDRYYHSFLIVVTTSILNIVIFGILLLIPVKNPPGLSYLIATFTGFLISYSAFNYNVKRLDRYIYAEGHN